MDRETRTKVAGENRTAAYDELLERALGGDKFDPDALTDEFRKRELDLVYTEANLAGVRSLRELSLKYYSDTKFWPLIQWANAGALPEPVTEESDPAKASRPLYIVHFIGWPR